MVHHNSAYNNQPTAARKLQASQPCRVNVGVSEGKEEKGLVFLPLCCQGAGNNAGGAIGQGAKAGGASSRVVLGEQGVRGRAPLCALRWALTCCFVKLVSFVL